MRTYRLGEFVAHTGSVNCVRVGRGTAGVLATGGEDKKVNLWRTGQTEVVKSLSGLQSSVECVVFGEKEDTIAAGGANGTVKVWDMESGKVSRSLTGHRANCLSLAFTASDTNFLISGSLDCNVKVWDLRRKEAIVTFKGHSKGVLKVAPSPDNRWVCSGSEDGELKLWDITSGKTIKDGWRHNSRVTGLEFNQVEFLMVSSGADRTVRVWDLEVWEEVECLGPEATAVQGIAYAPDGSVLLTATADALKVWGLEPAVHHDTVPMDWRNLADLHLYYKDDQPRALGCCCNASSVGVFMVDLRKVAPFCSQSVPTAAAEGVGSGGGHRSTAATLQHLTSSSQPRTQLQVPLADVSVELDTANKTQPLTPLLLEGATGSVLPEVEAGPLTRQLSRQRTPPRAQAPAAGALSSSNSSRQAGTAMAQSTPPRPARQAAQVKPSSSDAQQQQQQRAGGHFPEVEIRIPAHRTTPVAAAEPAAATSAGMQQSATRGPRLTTGSSNLQPAAISSNSRAHSSGLDPATAAAAVHLAAGVASVALQDPCWPSQQQQQQAESGRSTSKQADEAPGALSATLAAWLKDLPEGAPEAASKGSSRQSSAPASRMPSRHNLSTLQPQQQADSPQTPAPPSDPIMAAMATRPQLKVELARMVSGLQVAKGFANRGNLEGAYKSALNQGDAALACMLLEAVSNRADAFELNSLEPLIKLLELLLTSHEQQQAVGLSVLGLVLRGPGQTVHTVCSAPQPPGVDLSFETRKNKCLLLKMALEGLGMKLGVLSRSRGAVATRAQLLAEDLKRIVAAGQ